MSSPARGPQIGVDYGSRMEGGLLGAMARARERKRAAMARDAEQRAARKARRRQRLLEDNLNQVGKKSKCNTAWAEGPRC